MHGLDRAHLSDLCCGCCRMQSHRCVQRIAVYVLNLSLTQDKNSRVLYQPVPTEQAWSIKPGGSICRCHVSGEMDAHPGPWILHDSELCLDV